MACDEGYGSDGSEYEDEARRQSLRTDLRCPRVCMSLRGGALYVGHFSRTIRPSEASYFTNAVTEVLLEDGANLSHLKIQRESPRAFHVGTIEAEQKRDSHYQSFSFATGAVLSRTNVYTTLDGEGAGATLNGLYMR